MSSSAPYRIMLANAYFNCLKEEASRELEEEEEESFGREG
jgi:hypothetical protein